MVSRESRKVLFRFFFWIHLLSFLLLVARMMVLGTLTYDPLKALYFATGAAASFYFWLDE